MNTTRETGFEPEEGRGETSGRSIGKPYGGRCSGCGSVYVGASITLLYSDETGRYCRCGGRLREGAVELEAGRRYRLIVPEELRAIRAELRRRIERSSGNGARVEVVEAKRGERLITLTVGGNRFTGLLEDRRVGESRLFRGAGSGPKNRKEKEASREMTMFSGLEARSEMNELLDELYDGGTDRARPGEGRESGRHAACGEAKHLLGVRKQARAGMHQPSHVEVVTRQECGEESKQITLLASNHEGEDRMPAEERHADEPKKERGLVDKAVDKAREKGYVDESTVQKAREKGFIDKANEAVDKIKNRLKRR